MRASPLTPSRECGVPAVWLQEGVDLRDRRERHLSRHQRMEAGPRERLLPSPESGDWTEQCCELASHFFRKLSTYFIGKVICISHPNVVCRLRVVICLVGKLENENTEAQRHQTFKPAIHLWEWKHRKRTGNQIWWNLRTQKTVLDTATVCICSNSSSKKTLFYNERPTFSDYPLCR